MSNVAIYIRVSTENQAEEGYSVQEQRKRLSSYCEARGWNVYKIYTDAGWSGSNVERPALRQMIEDAECKKIDTVLVYKLDRLSRSQRDTLYLIEDVFLPNQVNFVSMQESFDTSTPFGRAVLSILSVFAQLERELITERTMMGRVSRAEQGLWHGGGTHPIGYDYIDGRLVVNKSEAEQVRMVFDMYSSGHSVSQIVEKMEGFSTKHGDWHHPGTVTTVLDNELYSGTVHFENVQTPKSHDAIVPEKIYKKVQSIRERVKGLKYTQKSSEHLLTGLLHCGCCSGRYFAKKQPSGAYKYTCHSRAKVNKKMIKNPSCRSKIYPKEELEQKITSIFLEVAQNPDNIKNTAEGVSGKGGGRYTAISEDIARIDVKINKYMELYGKDNIPAEAVSSKIDVLYAERKNILDSTVSEVKEVVKSYYVEGAKMILQEAAECWNFAGISYKQHVLRQLIDGIDIEGDSINIRWSFQK